VLKILIAKLTTTGSLEDAANAADTIDASLDAARATLDGGAPSTIPLQSAALASGLTATLAALDVMGERLVVPFSQTTVDASVTAADALVASAKTALDSTQTIIDGGAAASVSVQAAANLADATAALAAQQVVGAVLSTGFSQATISASTSTMSTHANAAKTDLDQTAVILSAAAGASVTAQAAALEVVAAAIKVDADQTGVIMSGAAGTDVAAQVAATEASATTAKTNLDTAASVLTGAAGAAVVAQSIVVDAAADVIKANLDTIANYLMDDAPTDAEAQSAALVAYISTTKHEAEYTGIVSGPETANVAPLSFNVVGEVPISGEANKFSFLVILKNNAGGAALTRALWSLTATTGTSTEVAWSATLAAYVIETDGNGVFVGAITDIAGASGITVAIEAFIEQMSDDFTANIAPVFGNIVFN
jgi:hypothetical protein